MMLFNFSRSHHFFWVPEISLSAYCAVILVMTLTPTAIHAQEILGLEVVKTLQHDNYHISAIDCYFINGHQLIAYGNSGTDTDDDTLVIYDFTRDSILTRLIGSHWSYNIYFIDEHQILFRYGNTCYRLENFTAPIVTELKQNVITFTVSTDKKHVAMLRYVNSKYQVEMSVYDSITGTLSSPDIYDSDNT